MPEDIYEEDGSTLELEHEEERVEDDEEEDEVLKGSGGHQPPDVVPTHSIKIRIAGTETKKQETRPIFDL